MRYSLFSATLAGGSKDGDVRSVGRSASLLKYFYSYWRDSSEILNRCGPQGLNPDGFGDLQKSQLSSEISQQDGLGQSRIHVPLKMNYYNAGDPLTFQLLPSSGQNLNSPSTLVYD